MHVMKVMFKLLCLHCLLMTYAIAGDADVDLYSQQIKPVLKARCFACHGALKQEADLRLDTVAGMKDHGILKSELLARITSHDNDLRMPPEGEALEPAQIEAIRVWIGRGAKAPANEVAETDPQQHWAFQKIQRPSIPNVGETNPIDAFLTELQQEKDLTTQPAARRSLLLRRLYLDLTGLPPTLDQLQSNQPLPQIIERLLNSPQYGERWGRHWMDVWRYSDWFGLGGMLRNSQQHIWHWRDWIVQSVNDDKSYAQMISEMVAGDEIAPLDPNVVVATGFLARNYYLFNRTTWLDNTIEHTSKAFLGLTVNCAKCHDHKYDPISHKDYYRLRAIFEPHHVRLDALPGETDFNRNALPRAYDDKPDAPTYVHQRGNPAEPIKDAVISPGVPQFLASFSAPPQPVELPVEAWAPGIRPHVQQDQLTKAEQQVATAAAALMKLKTKRQQPDSTKQNPANFLSFADNFEKARPDIWQPSRAGWMYRNGLLSQTKPTTDRNSLRTISNHPHSFELTLKFRITGGVKWKSTGIRFDADKDAANAHTVYASAYSGGSKVQLSHTVNGRTSYPTAAKVDRPIALNTIYNLNVKVRDSLINVSLDDEFLFAFHLPRREVGAIELFAFDATADFMHIEIKSLPTATVLRNSADTSSPTDIKRQIEIATAKLNLAETQRDAVNLRIVADNAILKRSKRISKANRSSTKEAQAAARMQLQVQLAQAELDILQANSANRAAAVKRRDAAQNALKSDTLPDYSPLRGSRRALDQKTHTASQYSPVYSSTSTGRRTALANWMTHRDNPLTARVAVNHIWMRHFGTPLVESVFDFGRRAPRPIHHKLLEYLAVELMESGWSMKHLHRLILNSKAWQRTSSNLEADGKTIAIDPNNQYYWRMNPRRMESQVVRDSLLFLSEQLDLKRGGPPIKAGPNVRRRSLYLVHSRDGRDQLLSTFDDADIFACYRRKTSIVPQQALAMLNSRASAEAAGHILKTMNTPVKLNDNDLIKQAFQKLLGRTPTDSEVRLSIEFLNDHSDRIHFIHALLNHNDFLVIR